MISKIWLPLLEEAIFQLDPLLQMQSLAYRVECALAGCIDVYLGTSIALCILAQL